MILNIKVEDKREFSNNCSGCWNGGGENAGANC